MAKINNTDYIARVKSGSTQGEWLPVGTTGFTNCYAHRVSCSDNTLLHIWTVDGTSKVNLTAGGEGEPNVITTVKVPDDAVLQFSATSNGKGAKYFQFYFTGDAKQQTYTPSQQNTITVTESQISTSKNTLYTGNDSVRINLSNSHPDLVSHRINLTFGAWTQAISVQSNTGYYDLSIPHSVFSSGDNKQTYANTDQGTLNIKVTTINNDKNKEFTPWEHDITLYLNQESNNLPTMTNFEISATRSTTLVNIENANDELPSGVIIQDQPVEFEFKGAKAKNSASIASYEVSGMMNGEIIETNGKFVASLNPVPFSGEFEFFVTAIDTRGFRSEQTKVQLYAMPYYVPATNGQADAMRCTHEKDAQGKRIPVVDGRLCQLSIPIFCQSIKYDSKEYNKITSITATCKDVAGTVDLTNSYTDNKATMVLTIDTSGQLVDASDYAETNYKTLVEKNKGFSPQQSYTLTVTVQDAVGSTVAYDIYLNTIPYTMHLQKGGKGVAFGKISEKDRAVEIASDWKLYLGNTLFNPAKLEPATTNSAGQMPALPNQDTAQDHYLNGKGQWASIPEMSPYRPEQGNQEAHSAVAGLVPTPPEENANKKFLRGDGEWSELDIPASGFSSWSDDDKVSLLNQIYPVGCTYLSEQGTNPIHAQFNSLAGSGSTKWQSNNGYISQAGYYSVNTRLPLQ